MRKYLGLMTVILLSWWAIASLFHQFMFPIHDDTQVVRVYEMAKALQDGQFPVRWVADLGYGFGYPIFNFYSPLPYYIGAIFVILGFNVLVATQLMFIIGVLASGVFMYLLAREFWGEWGGVISGLFFVYAPYHAVQIYVRGSVGEFWALAFLPLAAWGFYKVAVEPKWRWVVVGSMGYAGMILSHNITALIFTLILLITVLLYFLIAKKKPFTIYHLLFTILLGLSLSAFFWLPAFLEKDLTSVAALTTGGSDYQAHFVCPRQLWNSPWGFGGSIVGCEDGLSFKIGKLHILVTLAAFFTSLALLRKDKRLKTAIFALLLLFLFSVLMTLEYSKSIWQALPPLVYIQYPWRFLCFIIFSAAFLAGATFLWLKKANRAIKLGVFLIFLIILVFNLKLLPFKWKVKYFLPQFYLTAKAEDYLTETNLKWQVSKISDEYLPKDFPRPKGRSEVVEEKLIPTKEITLSEIKLLSSRYEFKTKSQEEGKILVKTAYFPGWKVFLNGKEIGFETPEGQILIAVPPGEHEVKVIFTNTPVRTASNLISFISWVGLLGFMLKYPYGRD